jgi:hypothetical protein
MSLVVDGRYSERAYVMCDCAYGHMATFYISRCNKTNEMIYICTQCESKYTITEVKNILEREPYER